MAPSLPTAPVAIIQASPLLCVSPCRSQLRHLSRAVLTKHGPPLISLSLCFSNLVIAWASFPLVPSQQYHVIFYGYPVPPVGWQFFILRYLLPTLFPFSCEHNCWFSPCFSHNSSVFLDKWLSFCNSADHISRPFHIFYLPSHFFLFNPPFFSS